MDKKDIRARLKLLRHTLDMTQSQFAKIMGITQSTYAYIEKGHRASITLDQLLILNEALGINPNWILLGHGEMYLGKKIESFNLPAEGVEHTVNTQTLKMLKEEINIMKDFLKKKFPDEII